MLLRRCDTSDDGRIRELLTMQHLDYDLPDLRMLVAALGVEDESKLIQAVLARPTVELYFLGDPGWRTPRWRWEMLAKLHEAMRQTLNGHGISDAHCWIPPEKRKFVGRLMKDFGWTRPMWTNLTRSTEAR